MILRGARGSAGEARGGAEDEEEEGALAEPDLACGAGSSVKAFLFFGLRFLLRRLDVEEGEGFCCFDEEEGSPGLGAGEEEAGIEVGASDFPSDFEASRVLRNEEERRFGTTKTDILCVVYFNEYFRSCRLLHAASSSPKR